MGTSDLNTRLKEVAANDIDELVRKDAEYGSSWKRRGGVGAFMQGIARKWDRLETQVKEHGYDIFAAIKADGRTEGVLDDIGDLRRYLMLLEAEVKTWPEMQRNPAKPDGMEHPRGFQAEEEVRPVPRTAPALRDMQVD